MKWIKTSEARDILGLKYTQTVIQYIHKGLLHGVNNGYGWKVSKKSVMDRKRRLEEKRHLTIANK